MLGSGGMGAVYAGVQEGLDRKVALKVLHPHLAGEKELLGRFQREAHLVASLGHPNVVQISDFQSQPGEPPFLVMELLHGENLRTILKRTPQLAQTRVAYIAMQVLSALDAAHRAKIVNRDIKPDNIFLEHTNVQADIVKVLDFGVAKLLGGEEESANKLTRQGFVVGTLAYMAPEQATGDGVDGRSDLYALGACMYVAIAGRKPFDGPTTTELLRAMLNDPPVPLTALRQDVDDAFWKIVERALAKKKEDRFATAAEMARALAPFAKPTTLEVALSVKPAPTESAPAITQPTVAHTPAALSSEPTPAPSTLPDDSGETPPPHTAPLPTQPTGQVIPVTQPMPAVDAPPFVQTTRMAPPVTALGVQPLMHQVSPPPVAVAPVRRSRSGVWAGVAGLLVLLVAAGVASLVWWRSSGDGSPTAHGSSGPPATAATPSATASSVANVGATADLPPLSVSSAAPIATVTAAPKIPARSVTAVAPSATEPVPALMAATAAAPSVAPSVAPMLGHAFAAPTSSASGEPLACQAAKQVHDRGGQRDLADRLAAQCVAQGGQKPF